MDSTSMENFPSGRFTYWALWCVQCQLFKVFRIITIPDHWRKPFTMCAIKYPSVNSIQTNLTSMIYCHRMMLVYHTYSSLHAMLASHLTETVRITWTRLEIRKMLVNATERDVSLKSVTPYFVIFFLLCILALLCNHSPLHFNNCRTLELFCPTL